GNAGWGSAPGRARRRGPWPATARRWTAPPARRPPGRAARGSPSRRPPRLPRPPFLPTMLKASTLPKAGPRADRRLLPVPARPGRPCSGPRMRCRTARVRVLPARGAGRGAGPERRGDPRGRHLVRGDEGGRRGPGRRHRHRHGGRRPRPALPRRVLRRRDHLRGDGAHPGRQGRPRRDGPGPQARRPHRDHRAALRAREGLLDPVRRLPRGGGRPHPHLPRGRTAGQDPRGGPQALRHRSRTRAALAVLVAEVRRRGGQRPGAAGAGVPQAAGLGHHEEAAGHPGRRAGAEPADRQELRGLRDQAAPAAHRGRGRGRRRDGSPNRVPFRSRVGGGGEVTTPRTEHLVLTGVLTAGQAAETVAGILAGQRPDGAIPWFRGHHLDPWDHVEAAMALDAAGAHEAAERAYLWLARHQNEDGSWYAAYADGDHRDVTDRGRETNFVAYV